jgi:hypothetical protein
VIGGGISEGVVEQAALDWSQSLGYATLPGAVLAHGGTAPEHSSYDQVVLTGRFREAALRVNPDLPAGAGDESLRPRDHRGRFGLRGGDYAVVRVVLLLDQSFEVARHLYSVRPYGPDQGDGFLMCLTVGPLPDGGAAGGDSGSDLGQHG